jgi:hypothetical protein
MAYQKTTKQKNVGHLVAQVHKNNNITLIPLVCDVIFCTEKHLKITYYVFCLQTKITSRMIEISGTFINSYK